MKNIKNIEILEVGYDSDNQTTNSNSNGTWLNSTPLLSLQKEDVVSKDTTSLNSYIKILLLDENLRENFLKGGRTMKYTYSHELNTPFLTNNTLFDSSAPLPYAEQLIIEVTQ